MKNLKLNLGSAFSPELKAEMNDLTMAGRWWLAYQLSGSDARVLEALHADAETNCDDGSAHRLAVFEDGSCINWHRGSLLVYYDVSSLLDHYDVFRPDRRSSYEAALVDYPAIIKYRNFLVLDSPEENEE